MYWIAVDAIAILGPAFSDTFVILFQSYGGRHTGFLFASIRLS